MTYTKTEESEGSNVGDGWGIPKHFWDAPFNDRGYAYAWADDGELWMRCPKGNGGTCWRRANEVHEDREELARFDEEQEQEQEEPEQTMPIYDVKNTKVKSFYNMQNWDQLVERGHEKAKDKFADRNWDEAPWLCCPCPGCWWDGKAQDWEGGIHSMKMHVVKGVSDEKEYLKKKETWKIIHPGTPWVSQCFPDEYGENEGEHEKELRKAGLLDDAPGTPQGANLGPPKTEKKNTVKDKQKGKGSGAYAIQDGSSSWEQPSQYKGKNPHPPRTSPPRSTPYGKSGRYGTSGAYGKSGKYGKSRAWR